MASSENEREARKVFVGFEAVGDFDLFERSNFAWVAVKEHWCLHLSGNVTLWLKAGKAGFIPSVHLGSQITPLATRELPIGYAQGVAEDWGRRNPNYATWADKDAEWRQGVATERQIETLQKLGVSYDALISKGDASLLISQKVSEKQLWKNEPPTAKQIAFLKRRGIAFSGLTKGQASQRIAEAKSRRH